jgi:hypothetical protein
MDGLSMLFGLLILIFFGLVFGINFTNTKTTKEGFQDSSSQPVSKTESQLRPVLDALAFYNSPGGTLPGSGNTDGEQLCTIFQQLRVNMAQTIIGEQKNSEAFAAATSAQASGSSMNDVYATATASNNSPTTLTNEEVAKQVEQIIASGIPGGSLPCPLLIYPQPGANDYQWLTFLYSIPDDFGARVVLMAMYADSKIGDSSNQLGTAMNKKTDLSPAAPPVSEAFIDVCTTDLAMKKREELREQSCTLPETLDPIQFQLAIADKLNKLITTKNTILTQNLVNPQTPINPTILSIQAKLKKLDQQKAALNKIMGS